MPREPNERAVLANRTGNAGPVELLLEDVAWGEGVGDHLACRLGVVHVDVSLLVGAEHPSVFHRDAGTAESTVLTAQTRWVNQHPRHYL